MLPASAPAPPDILAAFHAATARLSGPRLDLRWYPTVTSTMDLAEEATRAGAAEGLVIAAEEQTLGRGRRGRHWSSPQGAGLYLTFVLRPPVEDGASPALSLITLATGVGARAAIGRSTGLRPELKWPNDLIVGRRKLAGILAEGLGIGGVDQAVLVGLGINLRAAAHPLEIALRATSLEEELGRPVERALVFEELLVAVPEIYDQLRRGGTDDILRAWREAAPSAKGAPVRWAGHDGPHHGETAGIDQSGALLVKTAGGITRLVGGEIEWV